MLDFDFVCRRAEPSVVAMVYPFTGDHKQKYYWGHKEILISGIICSLVTVLYFNRRLFMAMYVLCLNYYNYRHGSTVDGFLTSWFVLITIKPLPPMHG
jgi:hypothetical protein